MNRSERRSSAVAKALLLAITAGAVYAATLPGERPRLVMAAVLLAAGWTLHVVRARSRWRLLGQSLTDPLTGLYNRRYLLDRLDEEIARIERYGGTLSLVMIDVDDFKKFNDAYGHPAGDEALRTLSRAIAGGLRRSDVAFRIGGEEFVLLMPDTQLADASRALQRVTGPGLPVGFSAGLSEFPAEAADGPSLLAHADMRLMRAKRHGKGQAWADDDGEHAEPMAVANAG